jgi:predicted glycoside hydrolase/deacetylase ChbG (UPF0249 family)
MPASLIVNADDFGLTPGVNRAIVELFEAGVLTSASLMATGAAADEAIGLALQNPGLGVGCHLNFVEGYPAAHPDDIPTLLGADGKTFRPSMAEFALAMLAGKVEARELALETQAQIQRLQRAGIDVTHVDTHKHTHVFPMIARTIVYIAQRCGVGAVRNPYEPRWSARLAAASLVRRGLLEAFRVSRRRFLELPQIAAGEVLTTDGTVGIAGTGSMTAEALRATLAGLPSEGVFELCCHPGHLDKALEASPTRLRASREAEFGMLLDILADIPRGNDGFSRSVGGLELIHYGELGIAGLQRASGQYQPPTGFEKVL